MAHPEPLVVYLVLTNGNPEEWCAIVDGQRKVIGRSQQCEIPLPKRYAHVSRRHAEIYTDHSGIKICDLGSRSGTRINGVWIDAHKAVSLVAGDRIWMGGVELDVLSQVPVDNPEVDSDRSLDEKINLPGGTVPVPAQLLLSELSQAELAVVMWIGRGVIKDEEIAEKLYRSPHTVRTQVNSIFRKLNVRSRADIISFLKRCE